MKDARRTYNHIIQAVFQRPWAIDENSPQWAAIRYIAELRAAGGFFSTDEIEARISAAQNGPRRGGVRTAGVAVIPIYGAITPRANLMSATSGGTTVEGLRSQFREALADPDVGAIVFDVDSPGGSVEGITELAGEIRAARGQKPMASVANYSMNSAAYWLASQADEVVASPSAQVGSVGIIGEHVDVSKADEMAGEKVTLITAGEGKGMTNPHVPLSDEARAELEAMAADYYRLFVSDVAAARGVKASVITDDWQAKVFTAKDAKAAGVADRVETLDATVRRLGIQAARSGAIRAEDPHVQIAAALAALPISEQLDVLNAEGERVAAHYAERARLRAKEGRTLPEATEQQLAALDSLRTIQSTEDNDLDTDEPEEAETPPPAAAGPRRIGLALYEAAVRGGYPINREEVPNP